MAGLWKRFMRWVSQDERELADEQVRTTNEKDRDLLKEDYEALKDDVAIRGDFVGGGTADYERDSERPGPGDYA
jgi:hypothetical protein